jgi:hypothetical protein
MTKVTTQADGKCAHFFQHLGPIPGGPDAEILVTHGRTRGEFHRIPNEQLRKRVRQRLRRAGSL